MPVLLNHALRRYSPPRISSLRRSAFRRAARLNATGSLSAFQMLQRSAPHHIASRRSSTLLPATQRFIRGFQMLYT